MFSPLGSFAGGGVGILGSEADEMVGFEVGMVASDWRPAATVLVTGAAVLTEMAVEVTTDGETDAC
jgi:hypothetical protein